MATTRSVRGFTIFEIVISLLVIGVIAASSANFLSSAFTNYFTGINATALSLEAAVAMKKMDLELRNAISFSVINPTQVSFTTVDGLTVTYSLSGTTLSRTGTTTQPLSKNVSSLSLNYYASNFGTTATLTAVRAVNISVTFSNAYQSIPLTNIIYLPNMK